MCTCPWALTVRRTVASGVASWDRDSPIVPGQGRRPGHKNPLPLPGERPLTSLRWLGRLLASLLGAVVSTRVHTGLDSAAPRVRKPEKPQHHGRAHGESGTPACWEWRVGGFPPLAASRAEDLRAGASSPGHGQPARWGCPSPRAARLLLRACCPWDPGASAHRASGMENVVS